MYVLVKLGDGLAAPSLPQVHTTPCFFVVLYSSFWRTKCEAVSVITSVSHCQFGVVTTTCTVGVDMFQSRRWVAVGV